MADEKNPPANPETPPSPPAESTPPPVNYASADEFREFQRNVEGGFNKLLGMLQRTGTVEATPATPIEDINDEELEEAIANGKGGSKLIRKAIAAAVEKVRRSEVAPLRDLGLGSIAKLTRHMATKEMKFYDRYRTEIDAAIDALPADQKLNPDLLIAIHNTIAGRPENIEKMLKEERERALRSDDAGGSEIPGQRRGDVQNRQPAVPTPRELWGEGGAQALEAAGRTPDRFAQGMGYRDWPHYVEEYKKGLETTGGNA